MTEEAGKRHSLWLWTWAFVAVSSAGYAIVNLVSSAPEEARGTAGAVRFLVEVVLPIGMCALASWFGVEEWRSSKTAG